MVKMRYLGPGSAGSMTLKRAYVDLSRVKMECRPGGAEYARLEALLSEIDATHVQLYGRPAREAAGMHVCGVMQTAKGPPDEPSGP